MVAQNSGRKKLSCKTYDDTEDENFVGAYIIKEIL